MKNRYFVFFVISLACFVSSASGELVGLWQFEGDASDSSLKSNDGTLENGATFSDDTPTGSGQSLSVAGGMEHVLVPHHESLDITSEISIAAWVKPIGNVAWDGVLAKNPSDGSDANHAGNYELRLHTANRNMEFLWQRGANNDTTAVADGGNAIADGDWTHLVFTGSAGGDYQFYVNGVPTTGGAFPDTFGHVNTNPLFIGSRNDLFTTWDGLLDDVAIFDRVLTEGQIQTILSGDFSVFLEPPSADFNGDGVVTELDYFVLSDHLYAHLDGPVVPADGDFNRDGSVDLVDFGMFKTEYPAVVAQALASVPEPSTVSLLLVAVWGLMGLPRRRLS